MSCVNIVTQIGFTSGKQLFLYVQRGEHQIADVFALDIPLPEHELSGAHSVFSW